MAGGSDFQRATKTWILAKHNEHETSVIHRLLEVDQITCAHFDSEEGERYSEYTADGPSALITYQYVDNVGGVNHREICIDAKDVGAFVAEIASLA